MSGIGTEIRVFCYAILTGVLIVAVYLWIRVLRRMPVTGQEFPFILLCRSIIRVMVFCGGISDWGLRSDQSGWRCFQLSL